jgi:cytochrome oxidase Cu insertion factor (SCO1/SenC/PrrC family)
MSMTTSSTPDQVLGLSVHTLPQPEAAARQRTRMGRLKMLLVWAVCAAPVVASYLSYYVIKPQGRSNYGALITPPVPLPAATGLHLSRLDGQPVAPDALKGQWLLVVVAPAACNAQCEQQLWLQRQLREVLGKDKDRLDRVWLLPQEAGAEPAPVRQALLPALAQAWVLRAPAAELQAWLKPEAGQTQEAHLYLVDPRGDWMMRFPANADPTRVKKDLLKLLKASESWDEAGR